MPCGYGNVTRIADLYPACGLLFYVLPLSPAQNDKRRTDRHAHVAVALYGDVNAHVFHIGKDGCVVVEGVGIVHRIAVLFPPVTLKAVFHFERSFGIGFKNRIPTGSLVDADRLRPQYGASFFRRYLESDFNLSARALYT